jgi:uncharacterized protein YjdB
MSGSRRTLAMVVMVAQWGWSCSSTAPSATPQVAAIVVSPATSTLVPAAQLPLRAQVQDGSGEIVPDADVTWTVQDPRIVSISPAGVVTALAVGASQVAANALGKSGIAIITVAPSENQRPADPGSDNTGNGDAGNGSTGGNAGAVAAVTVTAPSLKLETGSAMQLTATAKDGEGNAVPNQSFDWSTSDADRATVSATGVVTGKRPGDVTITAHTSSSGGRSGSLKLQVKKK